LSDAEVAALYRNRRIRKLSTRDEQEVAGYLEVLKRVFDHFRHLPITESTILQLQRDMLAYSERDRYHAGQYKIGSNRVEAKDPHGKLIGVVFEPTPPHLTSKEMHELCDWYAWAVAGKVKHPLLLTANFIFEFLAIHPFQDDSA
jgi:Fic family protein